MALADVRPLQVADPDAAVVHALAVEFAPQGAAPNQLDHGLGGGGTTRFVTLGCGETVEADRHAANHDRIAVPNVGDLAGQGATRTISGRG